MIMAVSDNPVSTLMPTLTDSLTSTSSSLPLDHNLLLPPADGISLLDTKNAFLLSYIQNLVFLIISNLRQFTESDKGANTDVNAAAIKKLVELRVYLERGVRPLEGRLKYQIDKVLRASDDGERAAAAKVNGQQRNATVTKATQDDESNTSDLDSTAVPPPNKPSDLSYRPNPTALLRKPDSANTTRSSTSHTSMAYKPPRITRASMPQATSSSAARDRRQRKSYLLDEYVSSELSSAPLLEPSIGTNSTILKHGRGSLSARQKEKERERTEYEERNLARLPGESKAEKRKARMRGEGAARNVYGGEQWVELGEVGDQVARSVGRNREREGMLERREKRRRDDMCSRDGGVGIGDMFERKRRVLEQRAEKKARRGK